MRPWLGFVLLILAPVAACPSGCFVQSYGVAAVTPPSGTTTVDFDSTRWVFDGNQVRKEEYLGRNSLFLGAGAFAHLKDVEFEDGTIEVDIAASQARAFLGVAFRFISRDAHEIVYFRPHKSGLEDATQYTPSLNGAHPWQLYSGPGFTAAADIPRDRWMHVKIEITGLTGKVYVDNRAEPVLVVTDLKRGFSKGSVGLWGSAQGGHFSNFRFAAANGSGNRTPPLPPASPAGTLEKWELSDAFDTAGATLERLPDENELARMKWQAVGIEPPGMVVIDRYRRSLNRLPPYAADPSRRLEERRGPRAVYARTTIHSDVERVKKLYFGYSDEISIFLNGRLLFTGRSAFRFRDPGFLGIMDVENDAVYLPLRGGNNQLVLAVSEYFGGWGFICRLGDPDGS